MIREYKDGDETKILRLFRDVFGIDRSLEYWKWQFKNLTQGESLLLLSEEKDDIVGHTACRANPLNFLGNKIDASQGCDTMVRVDQRGKGLFKEFQIEKNKRLKEKNFKACFSFPNRASYPGSMRENPRFRISLKYYYYRIGYEKLVGKKADRLLKHLYGIPNLIRGFIVRKKVTGKIKIKTSSMLDDNINSLLKEFMNYEVLSIWKDLAYMKWRYENHPQNKYQFHVIYEDELPMALAVCRYDGNRIKIYELIQSERDKPHAILLLHHIIKKYVHSKAQKIEFYGQDNGFFDYVFRENKFKIEPSELRFAVQAFGDDRLEKMIMIPQNWSISYGDSDVI
jgi:hypothetical protein